MKALMKPESSEYFRKIEKPVEDPEVTMNNIEAKKLSLAVGIDASETKQFAWFFQLVAKLKLPQHYTRYLSNAKDEVIYFNEATQEESTQHPSINILKIFFYEKLSNNKAIYTFVDKQSKLLPFVEEKMLRQSIGLNSKRRDAEKVNLQRDQSGRMVMSKLQKINPDFKSLLASRSYMLKMLVEKVFTRREIVGKGKRVNAFLAIIADYRKMMKQSTPQKQDEQEESQQNLALYHKIFESAAHYYMRQFGQLRNIPPSIINSREYIESTPQNVLKNIFLLNIDKNSIQLYWLARMMDCLSLPPNWTKKKGISFDSYIYEPQELEFDIHPSYIYIMNQLNKFKSIFKQLGSIQQNYYLGMRQLNYYDFFERRYTVDMYGYIEKAESKKEEGSTIEVKDRAELKPAQNSDWMVLQGIKNSPITPQVYNLIEHIEKFWDTLNFKDEPWCPAVSPYGEVVWSSNVNFKSINFNPYRTKLTNIIKNELKTLPKITDNDLKPEYLVLQSEEEPEQDQQPLHLNVQKIQDQRQEFLSYYLTHLQKAMPWPYQLKPQFSLFDENNYYEQIFTSPFELDRDLIPEGQEVPLWLQKVRAKNHTTLHTNLLTYNSQDFITIKKRIAAYALDMVGQHQPHLLEQTEKKLNRINNSQDLLKFLQYINDLDLREQRKKEYLESLKQLSEDSDIFGSEISQMDVEDRLQEEEAEEIQEKKSEAEEVKEPSAHEKSIHEQSQPSIIEQPQEIISQIVVTETHLSRQQYEFLRNFKKKKYYRQQSLSYMREEDVEEMIMKEIKKKNRKCKYKRGIIKIKINKQIQFALKFLNNEIYLADPSCVEERKLIKKNMIVTHLRSSLLPYRFNLDLETKVVSDDRQKEKSQAGCSEITDYGQFASEISDWDNNQIDQMIIEIKKNRTPKQIIRPPTERSQNEHEQTMDTIELQPIYQIKPEIGLDPVLRHVKMVSGELKQFRSTFNSKQIIKTTHKRDTMRDNIRKVESFKSLSSKQSNYSSTPAPQRNGSLRKLDVQSKLSQVKKQGMGSLPKFQSPQRPFHRVCLDKTASHFLEKQAFLKKGDLITMQARKTLLSKGRGLDTFISKFY